MKQIKEHYCLTSGDSQKKKRRKSLVTKESELQHKYRARASKRSDIGSK